MRKHCRQSSAVLLFSRKPHRQRRQPLKTSGTAVVGDGNACKIQERLSSQTTASAHFRNSSRHFPWVVQGESLYLCSLCATLKLNDYEENYKEEDFGFLKLILAETENLPAEETPSILTAAVNSFETAFNAFDAALKASATNPATASATDADVERDQSWRGINAYVKAMCAHPTAEIAATAAEAKSLFDKYGDPTSLAQTEESGVLHNLLQDLEAFDSLKRTSLALDVWIADLKTKEDAFLAAAARRTEEDAARQVGIVKETRTAADAAYRSLVDTVNALAMINGDAEYATFIEHVNAVIERQKSILKARTTRAKKEDEPAE